MADLGVKGSDKKRSDVSFSTIKTLPKELLVDILAKVASGSIFDLYNVKLSCKDFLQAAEDDYVYQHASMEKFALVPLPWFTDEKDSPFLKRCRESGNLEISYREGMVEYFSSLKVKSGLENLKMAAQEGHDEARYVYSMLLMCCEDEEKIKQGLRLFGILRTSTSIRRCRKRVKYLIRNMWVNNPMVGIHKSLCQSSTCDTRERLQKLSKGSSQIFEDEDDGIGISCEYCLGDYELCLFRNMFHL